MKYFSRTVQLVALLQVLCFNRAHAGQLNDTAFTMCYVPGFITDACAGEYQDASDGRDVQKPGDWNGKAGFNFTKLDAAGLELPNSALSWSCIRDNVTELTWENKTDDGSLHDGMKTFALVAPKRGPPTPTVDALIEPANERAFCGRGDWRVPKRSELISILDLGATSSQNSLAVVSFFPNTSHFLGYLTSDKYYSEKHAYWFVSFQGGPQLLDFVGDTYLMPFRMVSGEVPISNFQIRGAEIRDVNTGLTWKRCTVGTHLKGNSCQGTPTVFSWLQAVEYVKNLPKDSGKNWRLPNFKELNSIVSLDRTKPSIDISAFPKTPNLRYHTSGGAGAPEEGTSFPIPAEFFGFFQIDFKNGFMLAGNINGADYAGAIRLVRSSD